MTPSPDDEVTDPHSTPPLPDPLAIPVEDFPQPSEAVPIEEPLVGEESAPLQVEELDTGQVDPRPDPPDPARSAG